MDPKAMLAPFFTHTFGYDYCISPYQSEASILFCSQTTVGWLALLLFWSRSARLVDFSQ